MVTLLFKLLTIQMTMQLIMSTDLEGRTAHYVDLLETSSVDEDAERLTCAVYSIRPANRTIKYYKYTVSETQFNKSSDHWMDTNAITFKQCADFAASADYKMFLFDENECRVSNSLFIRKLPEPCADDTATVVYMAEPSAEESCFGENLVSTENSQPPTDSICGSSAALPNTCKMGVLFAYDTNEDRVYSQIEGQCYLLIRAGNADHDSHSFICIQAGMQSCKPKDLDSRDAYVERLRVLAEVTEDYSFSVDLAYDGTDFKWRGTDIVQPTDQTGGWGDLTEGDLNDSNLKYAYMSSDGLANYYGYYAGYTCCQSP